MTWRGIVLLFMSAVAGLPCLLLGLTFVSNGGFKPAYMSMPWPERADAYSQLAIKSCLDENGPFEFTVRCYSHSAEGRPRPDLTIAQMREICRKGRHLGRDVTALDASYLLKCDDGVHTYLLRAHIWNVDRVKETSDLFDPVEVTYYASGIPDYWSLTAPEGTSSSTGR